MLTILASAGAAVLSAAPAPSGDTIKQRPVYALIDCGELPGGPDHSEAVGLNNDGTLIGWSWAEGDVRRAFRWSLTGGIEELPAPAGVTSHATAIVENGNIYGWHKASLGGQAVRWQGGTLLTPIDDLQGGYPHAWISGVNDAGGMVGVSIRGDGHRGFVGNDSAMKPIPVLKGPVVPRDINNEGVIVGSAARDGGWRPAIISIEGSAIALEPPADADLDGTGRAVAIGSRGHIAGRLIDRAGRPVPVLWHPAGVASILGRGDSGIAAHETRTFGAAADVDARGNAVGWRFDKNGTRGVAWLTGIGEVELTSGSDEDHDAWVVYEAVAINEQGWIAANAREAGGPVRAVLLIPPSAATDLDGSGGPPDGRDFLAWLDLWKAGSPRADLAGRNDGRVATPDGILDGRDFLHAIELWSDLPAR